VIKNFKCPRGLENYDALCPQCFKDYPYMKKACKEYKKKNIWISACGCGGSVFCECGFNEHFCIGGPSYTACPFCGRWLDRALPYSCCDKEL